jgi:hypothetical protein
MADATSEAVAASHVKVKLARAVPVLGGRLVLQAAVEVTIEASLLAEIPTDLILEGPTPAKV